MSVKQKSNPKVVILAGPNGAGKTTASKWVLQGPMSVPHFVNADTIARGLSGFAPESVADIRSRYESGLENFFSLYMKLMTGWRVYDNSKSGPSRLIAAGSGIIVESITDKVVWKNIRDEYDKP